MNLTYLNRTRNWLKNHRFVAWVIAIAANLIVVGQIASGLKNQRDLLDRQDPSAPTTIFKPRCRHILFWPSTVPILVSFDLTNRIDHIVQPARMSVAALKHYHVGSYYMTWRLLGGDNSTGVGHLTGAVFYRFDGLQGITTKRFLEEIGADVLQHDLARYQLQLPECKALPNGITWWTGPETKD